jgi:hypothetical protein
MERAEGGVLTSGHVRTLLDVPGARVIYDPSAGGPAAQGDQFLRPVLPVSTYMRPDFHYLFTTFSGLSRPERALSRRGRFALLANAEMDAVVSGISSWTTVHGRTLPYATSRFQLWVRSSSRHRARLILQTSRPADHRPLLAIRVAGHLKPLGVSEHGARLCATIQVRRGFIRVDAEPLAPAPTTNQISEWQSDVERISAVPPVTRAAGAGVVIRGVAAIPGLCAERTSR